MKSQLKRLLPDWFIEYIRLQRKSSKVKSKPIKDTFTSIKMNDAWNSAESVSGRGSELQATQELIKLLPNILKTHNINSFLDIPCGDFNWMQHVDLGETHYIGGDIVESLIETNKIKYGNNKRNFQELDLTSDKLPQVDVIFCRDCLVHLSYKDTYMALKNIKRSKSTYVLMTSFYNCERNKNIITGQWRKLNFELFPFYFSKPMDVIDENYTLKGEKYNDKTMGLWKVSELKTHFILKLYFWFT